MADQTPIIVVFEVFDPDHRCKSVFCEDAESALRYARAIREDYGPPVRDSGALIVEHSVASIGDLVNMLNGYYECLTDAELEAAVAAE